MLVENRRMCYEYLVSAQRCERVVDEGIPCPETAVRLLSIDFGQGADAPRPTCAAHHAALLASATYFAAKGKGRLMSVASDEAI